MNIVKFVMTFVLTFAFDMINPGNGCKIISEAAEMNDCNVSINTMTVQTIQLTNDIMIE